MHPSQSRINNGKLAIGSVATCSCSSLQGSSSVSWLPDRILCRFRIIKSKKHLLGLKMKKFLSVLLVALVAFVGSKQTLAWGPNYTSRTNKVAPSSTTADKVYHRPAWNPSNIRGESRYPPVPTSTTTTTTGVDKSLWICSVALVVAGCPAIASATTTSTIISSANAFPAALVAYGHYLSVLGMVGCVIAERASIKANMDEEEELLIFTTDTVFGVFGILMLYTGYLRATEYEKGFDFYSHEPIFWLKLVFVAVFAASSLFNTTVLLKRNFVDKGAFVPIGDKLASRMIQICNAELTALALIPLTATFMARGVLYNQDIPWQIEAAIPALVFCGLTFKYVKEAIQFDNVQSNDL